MAKSGITNISGGGIGSDELTATKKQVLKGKTYVGADTNDEIGAGELDLGVISAGSGDVLASKVIVDKDGNPITGTLALTGNASDGQVLAGSTYYSTDPKTKRTGTIPNKGTAIASVGRGLNTQGLYYHIPKGYYAEDPNNPWVYSTRAEVASAIGLTAEKMVKGQSCLDMNGSTDWVYKPAKNEVIVDITKSPYVVSGLTNLEGAQWDTGLLWQGYIHPEWPVVFLRFNFGLYCAVAEGLSEPLFAVEDGKAYRLVYNRSNGYTSIYLISTSSASNIFRVRCSGGSSANPY